MDKSTYWKIRAALAKLQRARANEGRFIERGEFELAAQNGRLAMTYEATILEKLGMETKNTENSGKPKNSESDLPKKQALSQKLEKTHESPKSGRRP